jgi:hypothetical protein
MAYVGAANLAGTEPQLGEIARRSNEFFEKNGLHDHQIVPDYARVKPSLSEYEYYAQLKRDSERDGTSGNGYVFAISFLLLFASLISNHCCDHVGLMCTVTSEDVLLFERSSSIEDMLHHRHPQKRTKNQWTAPT